MNTPVTPTTRQPSVSTPAPHSTSLSDFTPHPNHQTAAWWAVFLQPIFRAGLLTAIGSALVFVGYDYYVAYSGTNHDFAVFVLHYGIALVYTVWLFFGKKLRLSRPQPKEGLPARMAALVLWLISAYALNREIPVFQESVLWLKVTLGAAGLLILGVAWLDTVSVRGQQALTFGLAFVWVLLLYQLLYTLPFYHFGVVGLLLLGVGGHIFIPLIGVIGLGTVLLRSWREHEHRRPSIIAGLLVPLVIAVWFVYQWMQMDNRIRYSANAINARKDDELPSWVLLAQQLPTDWITERYLKTGSVYSLAGTGNTGIFGAQRAGRLHDPLVFTATVFRKPAKSGIEETRKLMAMLYTSRHHAEERLWSGTNLQTTNVLTQVRIYPEYRLAYTEKIVQVHNSDRWQQQEALYTFHLPEGSVATSLSLWINGREEKGILTTKAKADSAYRTIVGVEQRDPSVVHWREGNRITVRVFPCPPGETRQVKVGITSPLRLENRLTGPQQLVYENPWFEGPDEKNATETVKLEFSQQPQHPALPGFLQPGFFDEPISKQHTRETTHQPFWEIRFDAPALATNGFRFGGYSYYLSPARQHLEIFNPQAIFLDLNQDWTAAEINDMLKIAGNRPVWVYDEGLVQLTPENRDEVIARLQKQRFSVFPFYRIPNPAAALLVMKGSEMGPQLEDLLGSPYAEAVKRQTPNQPVLRTFCLSKPSELVRTLSELGFLQTDAGSISELQSLVKQNRFLAPAKTDQSVNLPQSGVRIIRTGDPGVPTPPVAGAPDHLFRLYAYNHLLNQIGPHYFAQSYFTDERIAEARQANIVSPVSSLIVLETQQDYDRFGIKRPQDSLGNATLKNTGAVPEPHEWALLLVGAIWVFYCWRKGRYVGV